MEFTGERFIPKLALGKIEIEHTQRYQSLTSIVRDKVVLDAACGSGYGTSQLSATAEKVYGIDISEEAITYAMEHYSSPSVAFSVSSIENLDFPDKYFDVVVSFETIEHVEPALQEKFMAEISRVLKPDGILVMSTPDKLYYSDLPKFNNVFHVKEFYENEYRYFLERYFKHVVLFKQGFNLMSTISRNENDILARQGEGYEQLEHKYLIAVCSNEEAGLDEAGTMSGVALVQGSSRYTSKLYLDLGGGFSNEVLLYAELELHGTAFKVTFDGLDQIENIAGLKWAPLQGEMISLQLTGSHPGCTVIAHDAAGMHGNTLDFEHLSPHLELKMSDYRVSKLTLTGYIDILDLSQSAERLIGKIQSQEEEIRSLQAWKNVHDDMEIIHRQLSEMAEAVEEGRRGKEENSQLKARISSMLKDFDAQISSLRRQNESTLQEKNSLYHERNYLIHLYEQTNAQFLQLQASKSWKVTEPLRALARWMKKAKKAAKLMLRRLLKKGYKNLPLDQAMKQKLKNGMYRSSSFLIKDTDMYKVWKESQAGHQRQSNRFDHFDATLFSNVEVPAGQPGTIGIHLHLYYTDLMDEFVSYFNQIPYRFDLYVSIVHGDKQEEVLEGFRALPNADQVVVKTTPNRGRDVAPMFAEFGESLERHDYISHVHSKKSLYTGTQQDGWRMHLLDNLMGQGKIVQQIFGLFAANEALGMIYPETYRSIPYWAHTWLSNKGVGHHLLNRLGIKHDFSRYLDFPAGTMFWARTAALKPLFDLNLAYEDFAEEDRQIDGTIAHAIERSLIPIVSSQGFGYAELNVYRNTCQFNKGNRNLEQYWPRKIGELKDIIDQMDVVTFDIFDTLITRPLLAPDSAFSILELKVQKRFNKAGFMEMRKSSEASLRHAASGSGDCTLEEIYAEMARLYDLDDVTARAIMHLEQEFEIQLVKPRSDMIEIMNYAFMKNKKIILISDMYLDRNTLDKMLKKCGIHYHEELWLSSETKLRKDTGAVWNKFKAEYGHLKTLHIGDNEHSDVQLAEDRGLVTYHVMSGANMFYNTDFGNFVGLDLFLDETWGDSVLLGPVVMKEFNSPFALSQSGGRHQIERPEQLGYSIFGPIIMHYMRWLVQKVQADRIDTVLFLAREGYLLKRLFDKMQASLSTHSSKDARSLYFLTSRRSASVASFEGVEDMETLLDTPYTGTINDLLRVRYGYITSDESGMRTITLPEDKAEVAPHLRKHADEIMKGAQVERERYLRYCKESGADQGNIAVADLGYSGSTQFYLSKLMKKPLAGYYFVTNNKPKAATHGNSMHGYYGENEDYLTSSSAVYRYQLLLEGLLTSNKGQFMHFAEDESGGLVEVYGPGGNAQRMFPEIEKIMQGVEAYFHDVLVLFDDVILTMPVSKAVPEKLMDAMMRFDSLLAPAVKDLFKVEDDYCLSDEISVFDHYKRWFGM